MNNSRLVAAHHELLGQGLGLLKTIDDRLYRRTSPLVSNTSIGAQLRHVVDHYNCLADGLCTDEVDYTMRERNPALENSRHVAVRALQQIVEFLEASVAEDRTVRVALENMGKSRIWGQSTLYRELDFLLSHTLHHLALINVLCETFSIPTEADFGVSFATIRYRRDQLPVGRPRSGQG